MIERPVVPTADGSLTLWDERTRQHYHSLHGARRESEHVFIKNGLDPFLGNEDLRILELGFGTGLNALLACIWAQKHQMPVRYLSCDLYPLDRRDFIDSADPSEKAVWNQLLNGPWGEEIRIDKYFPSKKNDATYAAWLAITKHSTPYSTMPFLPILNPNSGHWTFSETCMQH